MALIIETVGNGVKVNGVMQSTGNWVVEPDGRDGVVINNKDGGVIYRGKLSEITVNGTTSGTYDDFITAVSTVLFKSGGTDPSSDGVQSITGGGVDNTDPKNPVITQPDWDTLEGKPTVIGAGATQAAARTAIGAGTSNLVIGTTAGTAMAGDTAIPAQATWSNISGKPAFVAEGADATAARAALGLGTAATTASTAYATSAQGTLASTAVQPATLDARLSAAQRSAINVLVSPEEDYADMTEATAAIKSIIDALQAV